MHLIRKLRLPALFCAFAVLACDLISRPSVNMGVCDDWPYILMAKHLATTGHILYNGWASPMLVGQLYLAAAFIKLFGFSPTTVRISTLLVAATLAFVLQRILVHANITERNATIGTLAFVLSPLYLLLSVTFMTDIAGLLAIVLCLYGCLRALQASTSRSAIAWLCFAILTNAICGTSRQNAWLGILVMVPSTLWLLRAQRRVLLTGAAVTLAGALFILACMHWLSHQPFVVPQRLVVSSIPITSTFTFLRNAFLDIPFLLLPVIAIFLPQLRKSRPRVLAFLFLAYILLFIAYPYHAHRTFLLEPTLGDWVNRFGIFYGGGAPGRPPIFLNPPVRILLTIASLGGMLGLIAMFFGPRPPQIPPTSPPTISWTQLGVLLAPFSIVYALILIPVAATTRIFDRYLLGLALAGLLCLVRYYQEQVHPRLPLATSLLIGLMAIYAITITHNTFAFDRARVDLATELRAAGVPDISVDSGWEYNLGVELDHADHINDSRIVVPANAFVPIPQPTGSCPVYFYDKTPHIHPFYTIAFDPNACGGPAPFAPIHYSRWLVSSPGTLYVVRTTAPPAP